MKDPRERRYIRLKELLMNYGLKRSTVYFWIKSNGFPRPIKLGDKLSVWDLSEVEDYVSKRREIRRDNERGQDV